MIDIGIADISYKITHSLHYNNKKHVLHIHTCPQSGK
jgi:hypothetical protein